MDFGSQNSELKNWDCKVNYEVLILLIMHGVSKNLPYHFFSLEHPILRFKRILEILLKFLRLNQIKRFWPRFIDSGSHAKNFCRRLRGHSSYGLMHVYHFEILLLCLTRVCNEKESYFLFSIILSGFKNYFFILWISDKIIQKKNCKNQIMYSQIFEKCKNWNG